MKNCKQCGGEFEPKNPKGRFCSNRCRLLAHRGVKHKPVGGGVSGADVTRKSVKSVRKRKARTQDEPPVTLAVATVVVPDPPQPRPVVTGGWRPPETPAEIEAARLAIERVRAENAVRRAVRVGRVDPPNCSAGGISGLLARLPGARKVDVTKPV